MKIDHQQAWELLCSMDRILLLTHRLPDGDALGSIFALYLVLKDLGKEVRCVVDKIPASLKAAAIPCDEPAFAPDFVVTVDVGDRKLLGEELDAQYGGRVDLCIDHHGTNSDFAKYTLVDPAAAAACEVLFDMLKGPGFAFTPVIAGELYVGIATDTGCFRYGNTTAKTMRAAADLMEYGVDTAYLNTEIFETKTREFTAFERMAMNALKTYFDGRVALMLITREMYERSGLDESDDKAINALPRQIEGVYVGITVKEKQDGQGFRVSMRSKEPVSAAEICASLGGGGHRLAAGCELTGTKEEAVETLLNAAKAVIDKVL